MPDEKKTKPKKVRKVKPKVNKVVKVKKPRKKRAEGRPFAAPPQPSSALPQTQAQRLRLRIGGLAGGTPIINPPNQFLDPFFGLPGTGRGFEQTRTGVEGTVRPTREVTKRPRAPDLIRVGLGKGKQKESFDMGTQSVPQPPPRPILSQPTLQPSTSGVSIDIGTGSELISGDDALFGSN